MVIEKNLYQEYRCYHNAPLNCDRPLQTVIDTPEVRHLSVKYCTGCGFPAILAQNVEIKGSRGIYRVNNFLSTRGLGRMYSGIRISDNQPIFIREYLLPNRSYNEEENRRRKKTFKRVAGVSLADGRNQSFRLINPIEAIADERGERCYLIIQDVEVSQSLRQYLQDNGAMEPSYIREFLNQALQTLQFLHTQKLRLSDNQIKQGMAHGNLSLDSILIQLEKNQNRQSHQQFYIYFCDLAVWECLFEHPTVETSQPQPEEDLIAIGLTAFYLWVGRDVDTSSGQLLNPKEDRLWWNTDVSLKQFLHRLIGLDTPFESAENARKELLQLPKPSQSYITTSTSHKEEDKGWKKSWILLWGILALILLGGSIWYFLKPSSLNTRQENPLWSHLVPNFSDVPSLPSGQFTYTAERDSTWSFILRQQAQTTKFVQEALTKFSNTTFIYKPLHSTDPRGTKLPLDAVRECKADPCQAYFAITSFPAEDGGLRSQAIANDGLFIYVAHSQKDSNLPKLLKGKISLNTLRKIYTGQITNWKDVDKNLPDLEIKAYAPTEPEGILLFQRQVLNNDPQLIAAYEKVTKQNTQPTTETIEVIVAQFEKNQAGIIAFGILSKVLNQCNAYPLAISQDDNQVAVQPLFQPDGKPIDPDIDLCKKRGSHGYYIDEVNFKHYPLSHQLFVVYPKDNSLKLAGPAFCKLLITREGQSLLQKAGLVPLVSIPENACQ
ncbi:MAG: substrate-binding domain-containing protein [Calothrix sp. C42_A2020_038]|nr:substrate-binding domain-containing protein [Calothrix sp. C42_A2020_038]